MAVERGLGVSDFPMPPEAVKVAAAFASDNVVQGGWLEYAEPMIAAAIDHAEQEAPDA